MKAPQGFPTRCDCGGKLLYEVTLGRVFSCCDTCTPVVKVPRDVWDVTCPRFAMRRA